MTLLSDPSPLLVVVQQLEPAVAGTEPEPAAVVEYCCFFLINIIDGDPDLPRFRLCPCVYPGSHFE